MGCLLVDRKVLEGFSFILSPNDPIFPDNGPPDIAFMHYCCKSGFRSVARLDVVCGHAKTVGGTIWPDREKGWRLDA